MRRALIMVTLAVTGCAHAPLPPLVVDKPQVVTVEKPVPVPCVSADFPPAPVFPDTPEALKAAKDFAERDRLVKGAWPLKVARLAALEAQVQACR